jgi:hypothetical protein
LESEYKAREQILGKLAQDLSKKLTRYCQSSQAQLQKGLWEIVSDAAAMDAEMAKQRAVYWIYMPLVRPRLAFDGGSMSPAPEDARTAREQADTVGIVVRPALMRTGMSSGQDCRGVSCLIDMDVWLQDGEEEPVQGSRGESRHGQRAENSGSREQQRGGRRGASMDVGRPRAPDGGGGATARLPVQQNTATVGGSDAAMAPPKKGTWYRQHER